MKLTQREIERRREIAARTALVRAAKAARARRGEDTELDPAELNLLLGAARSREGRAPAGSCRLCGKPVRGRGLCTMHWRRLRLYGDPTICRQAPPAAPCRICGRPGHAMGLCNPHYQAQYRAQRAERRAAGGDGG